MYIPIDISHHASAGGTASHIDDTGNATTPLSTTVTTSTNKPDFNSDDTSATTSIDGKVSIVL